MPYPHCPVAPLSLSLGQGCTKTREQRFVIFWPHPLPCALHGSVYCPSPPTTLDPVIDRQCTPSNTNSSDTDHPVAQGWQDIHALVPTTLRLSDSLLDMASGLCVCFDKMSQSGMVVQNIFIVSLSNRFWHQFSKVNNALCPGTINVTTGSLLLSTSLNVHATQRSIINISSSMPALLCRLAA